jgi:superfamily II DNA or RNA helicase
MDCKTLTFYQHEDSLSIIDAIHNGVNDILLAWGTGLGKTLVTNVLATELRAAGEVSHVVITTPSNTLIEQFLKETEHKYRRPGGEVQSILQPQKPSNFEVLQRQLTDPTPVFVVTTHALFRQSHDDIIQAVKAGEKKLLLVVDEAHHAPENTNVLGSLVTDLKNTGRVIVIKLTANPNRADNKITYSGSHTYTRLLPSMMAMGIYLVLIQKTIRG